MHVSEPGAVGAHHEEVEVSLVRSLECGERLARGIQDAETDLTRHVGRARSFDGILPMG